MRYLNKDEEQRLNDVLQRFSNSESAEKIDVRLGRTIAYRGVPGETPEIDRITPKQLENLEKAANNPQESTGAITIFREQVYQVQNGRQAETNTLQPSPKNPSPQSISQSQEADQIQASLAEIKSQNEKQQVEIARLRELMLEQNRLLQKLNAPVKERLGDWFNQVRERVSDRIQEFRSDVREKVEAVRTAAQERVEAARIAAQERLEAVRIAARQQVQSVASNAVTGIVQATGDRQVDGSVLLQANGQKFQATPNLKIDSDRVSVQQQTSKFREQPKEVKQATQTETRQSKPSLEEQLQQSQERLENSNSTTSKEQLSLEQLSQQQREQLFIVYARQQQQTELASLSQSEQAEFKRLVSAKEQEYLIEVRAKELKEEYEKQQSNKSNNKVKQTPNVPPPLLTQEYLKFKKLENTEKEAEVKRAERGFLGTKPPDSPHNFKTWYYLGTASEEFQLSCGIIPPHSLTPAGAVWHSQFVADCKRLEAEKLVEVEIKRLKEAGFSPEQIREKKNAISKQAYNKVGEEWKQERAEALKAWQESKGLESFQKFTNTQPQTKEQVEVKVADLEKWRQEAQGLGRSEKHLEKIDQLLNSAKETTNNSTSSVKINERDFKAMQRDRSEFKQQSQQHNQSEQTHAPARAIRR